jgi:hypothetical protein
MVVHLPILALISGTTSGLRGSESMRMVGQGIVETDQLELTFVDEGCFNLRERLTDGSGAVPSLIV